MSHLNVHPSSGSTFDSPHFVLVALSRGVMRVDGARSDDNSKSGMTDVITNHPLNHALRVRCICLPGGIEFGNF